ncbi:MAG: lipid kinase YegS [Gemmatimonadota bacterium]
MSASPQTPSDVRALLVLHGEHGAREDIREVVEELRAEGADIEVRLTWESGHAGLFAREGADDGRTVVAAGGDGTVHEVADALVQSGAKVPMGVLPLGTANDFAASAGIPLDDPNGALRLALAGASVTAVDVLGVGDKIVVNLASAGPATRLTVETSDGLKRVLGSLSYAVSGITQIAALEAQEGTVRGPDFEWSGRFLALAVGNGSQAGGGIVLCPDAVIDDGLLDVLVVPEGDGAGRLLLDSLLHGRDAVLEEASINYRGAWVEIETTETLDVNLDGEPMEGTSFRFEVRKGALQLALPDGSLLLGGGRISRGPRPT